MAVYFTAASIFRRKQDSGGINADNALWNNKKRKLRDPDICIMLLS
jgi:hypothetical protein